MVPSAEVCGMGRCGGPELLGLLSLLIVLGKSLSPGSAFADEPPITRDVPIQEFQNRAETPNYNYDAPPRGVFRSIVVAESFDEEVGFRRTHEIVPINPRDVFQPGPQPIFIVFSVYPHFQAYQVLGLCFPEQVDGLDPKATVTKDAMYLALEDDSGYLKLFPPGERWQTGKYKVEIHVGWEVSDVSLMGTMRFTVDQGEDK